MLMLTNAAAEPSPAGHDQARRKQTSSLSEEAMEAIAAGQAGLAKVRVLISAEGLPQEIALISSSGVPQLDAAALKTVKNWHFTPAKRDGQAIPVIVIVPIEFSLKPGKP
ncbi:energy transducer TonB [Chromobacterium subtsugae]|uniref:Energy transducer TonB n=2 Tax=Chromobacterium subtsugae TaxID=251747 RepID=A0ABS7FJK1_9NEIS|nr:MULTISPECIES: energy transducer TonB [Chromobacterium]MBW7568128.1 energy transducer TonB [Chromobacterium subtsugae]MBW8289498.1 energy transducer TonB [Chromobacterium subtsugae]WSE92040.1 energy transducer TonB [Chromobacterium subtsugae]WVH60414.1 energy transducer TonB [Chromobacterium subtsugae]